MGRSGPTLRVVRRVGASEGGRPLLDVLASWVADEFGDAVARARLRAQVVAGAVRVDGVAWRTPGRPLRAGAKLDALLLRAALRPPTERTDRRFTLSESSILYRDEWLIAVDKPTGLPTHVTADPRRPSLAGLLRERLSGRLSGSGHGAYLAVHQRLDRDTTGVVLFATDAAANAGLARAFALGEVRKTYLALVASAPAVAPGDHFTIAAPLGESSANGRVRVGGADAKPAVTEVWVRERLGRALLLELRPTTGRKHQIRAHLAHVGLPVLGDVVYGGSNPDARRRALPGVPRLMLHAARLELVHPVSGRRLVLESPLPADFADALRRERSRGTPAARARKDRRARR